MNLKPKTTKATLTAIVLAALFLAAAFSGRVAPAVASSNEHARDTLVFLSDTQAPAFLETLKLKTERNEEVTQRIFDRVLREKDLAAVFLLGDLIRAASTDGNWRSVDRFRAGLKQEGIPSFAALGNHEHMWSTKKGLANFRKRFPELGPFYYSVVIGPAAVIILDSNFDEMTEAEQEAQLVFYRKALSEFDADPKIRGVLVGCHQSPYTNSRIVSPGQQVQTDFVPPFLKSKKGRLFISGHAHAAEHFVVQGKDFLVEGGGGGLRHPVRLGPGRPYDDIFPLQTEKRPFHFLTIQLKEKELVVTYQALLQSLGVFEPVHRFSLAW
jgi:hypothetical protein